MVTSLCLLRSKLIISMLLKTDPIRKITLLIWIKILTLRNFHSKVLILRHSKQLEKSHCDAMFEFRMGPLNNQSHHLIWLIWDESYESYDRKKFATYHHAKNFHQYFQQAWIQQSTRNKDFAMFRLNSEILISQGIGSAFVSFWMIFQSLQSEFSRFKFHSLGSKILKSRNST